MTAENAKTDRVGRVPRYLALLRGINVGGKNILTMKDLASLFATTGCNQVETYIQSGNIFFCADPTIIKSLPEYLSEQIKTKFRLNVPVVLRTARDLERLVQGNPFLKRGIDESLLHVVFLKDKPNRQQIAAIDYERSPGDEFVVEGREIHLHLPRGAARTKLTAAYFDSTLNTISTQRNWRTVLRLNALLQRC